MTDTPRTRDGLPLAEFMALGTRDQRFELIDGEVRELTPHLAKHDRMSNRLGRKMGNFADDQGLGEVMVEATFVLPGSDDRDWVRGSRVPDIMFIAADRIAEYERTNPDWADRPLALAPDLVVEIVSPNDPYTDINAKVARYLEDGVRLVWVLDPQARTVVTHAAGSQQSTHLSGSDTLDGGAVLPGFTITVDTLFAEIT